MDKKIDEKRIEILKEHGFDNPPICDLLTVFSCHTLALDSKMSVSGDHGDEHAYIYYACKEVNGELLDGLFYVPSLLEYLYFIKREQNYNFNNVLQELNKHLHTEGKLVFISGCPAIFIDIYEYCWTSRDLRFEISDMLKIVGTMDYVLNKELQKEE